MKRKSGILLLTFILVAIIFTACGKLDYFEEMSGLPMPTNYENWVLDYKDTTYEKYIDYYFTFDTDSAPKMLGRINEYYSTVKELGFEIKNTSDDSYKYIFSGDTYCTAGYTEIDGKIYFTMTFSK